MGPFAHSFAIVSIPYSRPVRQFAEGLPEGGARALSQADCGCFAAWWAAPVNGQDGGPFRPGLHRPRRPECRNTARRDGGPSTFRLHGPWMAVQPCRQCLMMNSLEFSTAHHTSCRAPMTSPFRAATILLATDSSGPDGFRARAAR